MDCLFISPDSSRESYQALADTYAAIETPTWCLLLAGALRRKYEVGILDPLAEGLDDERAWRRIAGYRPRLICFVIYGQNPNSGTTNMAGAIRLASYIRERAPIPIAFIGSHPSALPEETLALRAVDYVLPGDGLKALEQILENPGPAKRVVWSEPSAFSEYAWDLLPTLDAYRAHYWHAGYDDLARSPFAALYTSLGCPFKCDFCMINLVNRSRADQLDAADSAFMRILPASSILDNLQTLQDKGVKNVRLSDEMFFLDKRHYLPIVQGIAERGIDLNLWAYARVDTVRPEFLEGFKKAGINWLCLGIEAANQKIRREISKGSFEEVDVRRVVSEIRSHGIKVLSNFIFGLPDDDLDSMQETLDLALELNCEHTNFYPCMALPGTPLYRWAVKEGFALPETYSGYSFHSYDCVPLPTKHLPASEVLRFRDEGWRTYFSSPGYLDLVERTFGAAQRHNVEKMTSIRLKRKLLGD